MPTDEEFTKVFKLKMMEGIMMTTHEINKPHIIKEAMTYMPRDGDAILNCYGKTGSTWLMYVIWEILNKGAPLPDIIESYHKAIPNIEITGSGPIDDLQHPRFYKQHLPCNFIQINPKAKYVYIHRRPEDVLASYYPFQKFYAEHTDFDFDFFFEAFMKGMVWYGDYFEHVLAAYKHKDDENWLFVSYEEIKKNTRSEFLRIAEFLGEEYANQLKEDEEMLSKILHVTSFDYMKKNLNFDLPIEKDGVKEPVDFFRKGVVGDGKNLLNPEQRQRLNAKIKEKMAGTGLVDTWLS